MEFSFFLLRIWLSLAAVLAIGPTTPGGQIRQEQHARLRAALAADDLASVENQLREMGRSAPEAFARNNYDYLLARILMRRGNATEANRFLQQVVTHKSVLAGYALLHQAELARTSGNYPEEQRLLERLLSQHSGFLHREGAIQRLGASYLRTGKYQNVISTLSPLAGTRGATAREGLARIGEAQLALGQEAAARATFQSLLASGSLDDGSLRAITFLDRMDESAKTSIPERERVRRARIYQFNRSFVDARKHWLAVVNDYAQSTSRAEALFQLGRGYFLEENYTEAIRWYDRAHDQFPDTEEGEEGYYFAGHSYQALRDVDRAIARYEAFLRAYPRSKYFGYAFLNAIDTLRSAEARALARKAEALARGRTPRLFRAAASRLTPGGAIGLPDVRDAAEASRLLRERGARDGDGAVWIAVAPEDWDALSQRAFEAAALSLPEGAEVVRIRRSLPPPSSPAEWRDALWAPCGTIAASVRFYERLAQDAAAAPEEGRDLARRVLRRPGWAGFAADPTGDGPWPEDPEESPETAAPEGVRENGDAGTDPGRRIERLLAEGRVSVALEEARVWVASAPERRVEVGRAEPLAELDARMRRRRLSLADLDHGFLIRAPAEPTFPPDAKATVARQARLSVRGRIYCPRNAASL